MTSAPYLDDFLLCLDNLPAELQKNLALMGELDSRSQKVMRNIDKLTDSYMSNVKKFSEAQKKKAMADIQHQFDIANAYSDDKVQLSIQTYEIVDKQIRGLDNELKRYKGECQLKAEIQSDVINAKNNIQLKKEGSKMTSAEPSKTYLFNAVTDPKKSTKSVANYVAIKTSSLTGALVDIEDKHSTEADMPIDPNEPTFCLCDQVSFGQMICCDNPDCPIEWFHFECVDLITKPKRKWICPKCVTNKK